LKLPGGESVEVDPRKLVDYALSPTHPVGKHKARLFASRLGLTQADAPALEAALRTAATSQDATLIKTDAWGQRWQIDFMFQFGALSAMITSGWIVPADGSAARLTSVFIARDA
jgi:hypothetical protein